MSDEPFRRELIGEWKVADPVKVAVEAHPLPWRVKEFRGKDFRTGLPEHSWIVIDLDGKYVADVAADIPGGGSAAFLICDAVNRYVDAPETKREHGEMLDMLRPMIALCTELGGDCGRCWSCRKRELLARIDARSAKR